MATELVLQTSAKTLQFDRTTILHGSNETSAGSMAPKKYYLPA